MQPPLKCLRSLQQNGETYAGRGAAIISNAWQTGLPHSNPCGYDLENMALGHGMGNWHTRGDQHAF